MIITGVGVEGGVGVLPSLSTSLTLRNMHTLHMLSYDHQGGVLTNALDEYFPYVTEHEHVAHAVVWCCMMLYQGLKWRPTSMLHKISQQVYQKKIHMGLQLDMASQCCLVAVCGFCVATSALALKRREEETRRRMARERRGAGSSVVRMERLYYKTIY